MEAAPARRSKGKRLTVSIETNVDGRIRPLEPWEINRGICPPSLCPASDSDGKRPRGTGGRVFYHGDIVLDPDTEYLIFGNKLRRRFKRETMKLKNKLWPNGVVPYIFSSDLAPSSRRAIIEAMHQIRHYTCIIFKEKRTKDENYIRFISEPGCWSSVGMIGGEQRLSIGKGCEKVGTAVHEIAHALGFWHEQARTDRDNYVRVLTKNVSPDYLAEFTKINSTVASSRGYPYDYNSVMHYSEYAFSNTGYPTIKVKGIGRQLNYKIGQREQLSDLDIAQLRDMYRCDDREDEKLGECPEGWKKKLRSCYKFMADSQYRYQYAAATKYCKTNKSHLLSLNSRSEQKFISKYLKKKYPQVRYWRTSGKRDNGRFVWNQADRGGIIPIAFTNWADGYPGTYTSMLLDRDSRYQWTGAWAGSLNQLPDHAYNFVCERPSKRKCVPNYHKDGRDYRGTLDHTVDGILCQRWTSHYPHKHTLLPQNTRINSADEIGEHNFCRNPSGLRRKRPWCFTTKSKTEWQYCDVVTCTKSLKSKITPSRKTRKRKT
ncbi:hypothetical protein ScPMuIL_012553 [Solemya velum]